MAPLPLLQQLAGQRRVRTGAAAATLAGGGVVVLRTTGRDKGND